MAMALLAQWAGAVLHGSANFHQSYYVTPDDQRFVMIRNSRDVEASELIVVENFAPLGPDLHVMCL